MVTGGQTLMLDGQQQPIATALMPSLTILPNGVMRTTMDLAATSPVTTLTNVRTKQVPRTSTESAAPIGTMTAIRMLATHSQTRHTVG